MVAIVEHFVTKSGMITSRKADEALSILPPHPKTTNYEKKKLTSSLPECKDNFMVLEIDVVVQGQHSFCRYSVPRHESVVQAVLGDFDEP